MVKNRSTYEAYRMLPQGLAEIECQITALLLPSGCYEEPSIQAGQATVYHKRS